MCIGNIANIMHGILLIVLVSPCLGGQDASHGSIPALKWCLLTSDNPGRRLSWLSRLSKHVVRRRMIKFIVALKLETIK